MIHDKLDGLMTPVEKIARVANAGLIAATAPQTAPSGAISLDNADGTRTIIGEVVNGESNPSYTMATHVGDTTPPGVPTGITATSKSGVVVVEWDGTLDGGIPDDFFCVRVYLDGAELGALTEAGSVASAKLDGGTTVSVTATSEDDCCLPDGTPDHNVSAASQAISITVTSSAAEVIVDVEDEIQGIEQEITDFKGNTYTKAETDKKVKDLDDEISTELTTNYYNRTQIDTTYATKTLVSQTKDEIKLSASQTYATKGESQPNLSPFFAHDLTDIYNASTNPDGYFWNDQASSPELGVVGTQLDDGWMHYELDNSARTDYAYIYLYQRPLAGLRPSTLYTLMMEFRNMDTDAGVGAGFRITTQADDATHISQTVNPNGYDDIYLARGGTFCKALSTKPDMSAASIFCRQYLALAAGKRASFDVRFSLYETASPEILLDTNAPTLSKVDGPFDRYLTDTAQTQVTAAYGAIADPPEELGSDARYGISLDFDGSHTTWRTRSLGFYSGSTTGDTRPTFMEAGRQYQASVWARKVSGTAYLRIGAISSDRSYAYQPTSTSALALTDEWQLYSVSLRPVSPSYSRIAFGVCFSASTAGAVELCGFSLQEMDATFKPYVTDQTSLSKEYSTKSELIVGLGGIKGQAVETYEEAIKPIVVGGRNLITLENTYNGFLNAAGGLSAVDYSSPRATGLIPSEPGTQYCLQGWTDVPSANKHWLGICFYDSAKALIGSRITKEGADGDGYILLKATAPDGAAYVRASWRTYLAPDARAKLEAGTTPTDYTAAPEDLVARPNLTPFGSHPLDDVYDATGNPNGYWRKRPDAAYVTQLADGWLHFERINSGTGVVGSSMQIRPIPDVEPGDLLTVLIEVRNNQSTAMSTTGNFDDLYVQQGTNFQLWGAAAQSSTLTNSAQAKPLSALGESFELRFTKVVDSGHKTGDYIVGFAINIRNGAGQTLSFDFRVSVYKGGYGGGYVPYSIEDTALSKTYTRSAYFEQTAKGFDERITVTEDGLAVQETLIRQYAGGVLVAYTGNSVGALVNAAGQYDIVSLTWQGGEPTVGTTLAKFGQESQIGQESETFLGIDSRSMRLTDGASSQTYFEAADLRGDDGVATLTSTYIADGITATQAYEIFILPLESIEEVTGVTLDGTATTRFYVQNLNEVVVENTTKGQAVAITYTTESVLAKAYTLGIRRGGSDVGAMSVAEGIYTMAQGAMAHAEGSWTQANGEASHAGGESTRANGPRSFAHGTDVVADLDSQTVVGKYNALGLNSLFEVGTGDPTMRESGFWVGEDGATRIGTYGTAIAGVFFGSKVVNPAGAAYATLFTSTEAVTEFGQAPNAARDIVLVMNGDPGAYQGQMTAALTGGNIRAYFSPTKNGNIRVNYIVILGA